MSTLDRARRPPSGPIRNFAFPAVDRRSLPNGLDLRVAHMSRLPVVSVKLFMRGGESALAPRRGGLAVLTGAALEGGTKRRSGTELADALERIGARVNVGAGWEGTSVGLSCLAERLPEALALLAEAVLEPSFPESEVERAVQQHVAGIRQRAMDPGALASDAATARYFDDRVPFARPVDGFAANFDDLGRDALVGYADAAYRPEGGGLVVVGDVDTAEVEALACDHFGAWTGAPAPEADFVVEPATRERRVWIVDRPGSVQSEIRVGHVGVARDTADYFELAVANMVLGGMFTSRLNLNLRERNGFTYGVRSRFAYRSRPGYFQVSTSVGNDVTAPAVREIVSELEAMAEGGPTEDEVVAARDYAAGVFGLHLETASDVATRVSQLIVYGLPGRYYHDYRASLRAVERARAEQAAERHIRPGESQVLLVGDAGQVRVPVEELALGPVEVVSAG